MSLLKKRTKTPATKKHQQAKEAISPEQEKTERIQSELQVYSLDICKVDQSVDIYILKKSSRATHKR